MSNHSNECLRDCTKESFVELYTFMINAPALHSETCFKNKQTNKQKNKKKKQKKKKSILCSQVVFHGLLVFFLTNEISWSAYSLRDVAF